jgi:hypothetical protein
MNAKVTLNIASNATLLDQEHDLDFLVDLLVDSTNALKVLRLALTQLNLDASCLALFTDTINDFSECISVAILLSDRTKRASKLSKCKEQGVRSKQA